MKNLNMITNEILVNNDNSRRCDLLKNSQSILHIKSNVVKSFVNKNLSNIIFFLCDCDCNMTNTVLTTDCLRAEKLHSFSSGIAISPGPR